MCHVISCALLRSYDVVSGVWTVSGLVFVLIFVLIFVLGGYEQRL